MYEIKNRFSPNGVWHSQLSSIVARQSVANVLLCREAYPRNKMQLFTIFFHFRIPRACDDDDGQSGGWVSALLLDTAMVWWTICFVSKTGFSFVFWLRMKML